MDDFQHEILNVLHFMKCRELIVLFWSSDIGNMVACYTVPRPNIQTIYYINQRCFWFADILSYSMWETVSVGFYSRIHCGHFRSFLRTSACRHKSPFLSIIPVEVFILCKCSLILTYYDVLILTYTNKIKSVAAVVTTEGVSTPHVQPNTPLQLNSYRKKNLEDVNSQLFIIFYHCVLDANTKMFLLTVLQNFNLT